MKERRTMKPGTGVATILLIFVILAMTILSVLSYLKAMQDHQALQQEYAFKEAYYQADAKAQYIRKQIIDDKVVQEIEITKNEQGYHYELEILKGQFLQVKLDFEGNILQWQTIYKERVE